MNKAIIRGRSIDGTVYLQRSIAFGVNAWTDDIHEASRFTSQEAEQHLSNLKSFYSMVEPNTMIGRLAIITAPRPLTLLQRWWRDVIDYADDAEYFMHQFGSLVDDDYKAGPQPTRLGLILLGVYATTFGELWAMIRRRQCEVFGHGKHWVDESYGGPDSGCDAGHCTRCGWSFHHKMY